MTDKEKLLKLIIDYGNIQFDCGAFDEDNLELQEEYGELIKESDAILSRIKEMIND